MANVEHLAILQQGVEAWNTWYRQQDILFTPDLKNADLQKADLQGVNLGMVKTREG